MGRSAADAVQLGQVLVTVSYELTDLGLSLHRTMRGLRSWAQTHMAEVLANREDHDARTP